MSMLSQIVRRPGEFGGALPEIHFIYASRGPPDQHSLCEVFFLDRLQSLSQHLKDVGRRPFALDVFLTPYRKPENAQLEIIEYQDETSKHGTFHHRRFTHDDLIRAVGHSEEKRRDSVVYVCGPPAMTDEVVDLMVKQPGLSKERILCERWW